MTEAQNLSALIERLENCEGADRELDFVIHQALAPGEYPDDEDGKGLWRWEDGVRPPFLTSSLDAALALVERKLPGCGVRLNDYMRVRSAGVFLPSKVPGMAPDEHFGGGYESTLPLALCLALLRALQSQEAPND